MQPSLVQRYLNYCAASPFVLFTHFIHLVAEETTVIVSVVDDVIVFAEY